MTSPKVGPIRPLTFPADQYMHPGAPTEWWWHTGTLKSGDRTFGFEINAVCFGQTLFSQVMLTDVANQKHYSQNTAYKWNPQWAEIDPSKDWYVRQADPVPAPDKGTPAAFVTMAAPRADPTRDMKVQALLYDQASKTRVSFDLTLSQEGPPMLVWGTGIQPSAPGGLQGNNFYYSLTRLRASGSIVMGGETIAVQGLTWMDHEYGMFGTPTNPVKWILQDIQMENGVSISNFALVGGNSPALMLNQPSPSQATVQFPDGTTYFVKTSLTPRGPTWVSPTSNKLYYTEFQVDLPSFDASFRVKTLMNDQEFVSTINLIVFQLVTGEVYEGVATATGTFMDQPASGTAWIEQAPA
jgi:predicted secreted hydrolase